MDATSQGLQLAIDGLDDDAPGPSVRDTTAYYSISAGDRDVYHAYGDCPIGSRIIGRHRRPGTGFRQRCQECLWRDMRTAR